VAEGREKPSCSLFFHLYTRRLSFLSKTTDADKEKSSAGDRALARLQETRQEANVHKHTRAYSIQYIFIDLERKYFCN